MAVTTVEGLNDNLFGAEHPPGPPNSPAEGAPREQKGTVGKGEGGEEEACTGQSPTHSE